MEERDGLAQLPGALLPWYQGGHRDLPWRQDREPYHVWLSEIMLQQTRVEAVKGYYTRFLQALPDIPALAQAEDELLHKLWEGLGYYSRVRNLKKAAQQILQCHGGGFPREYDAIRSLPGIGDYTAGAISSICFDAPTPAVDGNVLRVVARITANAEPIDSAARKNQVRQELAGVYPAQAGEFAQALMELGATVCGPNRRPQCDICPCRAFCLGRLRGVAEALPVKLPKREKRREEKTIFLLEWEGHYALEKRPDQGLLAGLWQFPNVPGKLEVDACLEAVEALGLRPREIRRQVEKNHIFTHIQWDIRGFYIEVAEKGGEFVWMTPEEIRDQAALPTAFRQFWEDRYV